jgi:hypothetical protein
MIKKFVTLNEKIEKSLQVNYKYKRYSKDESNRQDYSIHNSDLDSYIEILLDQSNIVNLEPDIERHLKSIMSESVVNKYNINFFNKSEEVFNYNKTFLDKNNDINILNKIMAANPNDSLSVIEEAKQNIENVYARKILSEKRNGSCINTILSIDNASSDGFFRDEKIKHVNNFSNTIFDTSQNNNKRFSLEYQNNSIIKKSLRTFYRKVITDQNEKDDVIYKTGYHIEKYLKNEQNELVFLTTTYRNNELYDRNVNYGQTYVYIIREVYVYEYIDEDDDRIKNYSFICGSPYYSGDILCTNKIMPSIPDSLCFHKSSNGITITWDIPQDSVGNIKGIQVLKRSSVEDPFVVIAQLESHEEYDYNVQDETIPEELITRNPGYVYTEFLDKNFDKSKNQIYAVRSIASTGEKSNYSEQVMVYYDYLNDKIFTEVVALRGCPVFYPNLYLCSNGKYFESGDKIIDNGIVKNISKIKVYLTPQYVKLNNDIDVLDTEDYRFELYNMSRNKKIDYNFKITNL